MEILWDQLGRADWTALLDGAGNAPFQQTWDYGVAAAAMEAATRRAVVYDDGRAVAMAQVIARRGTGLTSCGPVWVEPLDGRARRRILRRLARVGAVTLATPGEALAGFGLVPLVTARHHAVWDLAPSSAVLRSGLDRKWRGHLCAAERGGWHFGRNRRGALEVLITTEAAQRTERGYRNLPPAFTRAAPPGALRVWDWCEAGQVRAAMAFVRHGASASYHLALADGAARLRAVHQAMLWQAALALRADGVCWLDLGGVNTMDAPGLARFKLGTGAAVRVLGATCWVLPG